MTFQTHIFRTLLVATLLFVSVLPVAGQSFSGGLVSVSELSAEESDGVVRVSFTADVSPWAAGRNELYLFQPVLTDGEYRVSLPAVAVAGKGVRRNVRRNARNDQKINDNRNAREISYNVRNAQNINNDYNRQNARNIHDISHNANRSARSLRQEGASSIRTASPGDRVRYSIEIEAQAWMHGGQLVVESVSSACGVEYRLPDWTLSDDLRLYNAPQPREIITEVRRPAPLTVADSLSGLFTFVVSEASFDPTDPFRIYDEEREGALIVYFGQSRCEIDPAYRDNAQTLRNLTAVTELILADPHSRLERVVVAGFSSPEGPFALNDLLAFNRAAAIKHYLLQETGLRDEQVWLHNGSEDWRGLRLLVDRSDMPDKEQVLAILSGPGEASERLSRLKRLSDGAAYRYILRELFPQLRNGAFIKVYYSPTER